MQLSAVGSDQAQKALDNWMSRFWTLVSTTQGDLGVCAEDEVAALAPKQKRARGEEDDFYAAAKAAGQGRKKARQEAFARPELMPPLPEPVEDGARK